MTAAPASAPPVARLRDEFPVFHHARYLNSCSLGALSRRSRARVSGYLDLRESRGASAGCDVWWAALAELRERYRRVIGAPARVADARPGHVRISPYLYNERDDHRALVELLAP
ncbi:MAG TPA: hypothetical protein VFU46_03470 [Gemmatimonadales bacterium]|nr:hypothetical protein [Gemmatimonadales bacterium]